MDTRILLILAVTVAVASPWSLPFYPVPRAHLRVTRFAPVSQYYIRPIHPKPTDEEWQRPKRDHHHDYDDHEHRDTKGITGPVHTFVKTDKNANYKWGVRHHVGNQYAP